MGLLLRDLVTMGENLLKKAGVPDYEHDARALLYFSTGYTRTEMFMYMSEEVDDLRVDRYLEIVDRRCSRIPLQYITGVQNFMGIDFKVNENVLIPRQDTERLVENAKLIIDSKNTKKTADMESPHIYEAIISKKHWKVLDLCTGSGCIGVSLAKLCDNVKKVTLADISLEALKVAVSNASDAGVEKKIEHACGDLFAPLKKREKFDMIISNPPYIRDDVIPTLMPEVKDNEPHIALKGGIDGLDIYRRIIEEAPSRLEKGGVLALEIGYDQAEEIETLLRNTDAFSKIEVIKDYGNNNRVVLAMAK